MSKTPSEKSPSVSAAAATQGVTSLHRAFALTLITMGVTFVGEMVAMFVLPFILPVDSGAWTEALWDSTLLSLILGALVLPLLLVYRRKTMREGLRAMRVQYALDQHAIVSITDVTGTITFVNDLFCKISGYSREELVGQNHRLLRSGEHTSTFFSAMWRTIANGDVWQGDLCNRNKAGALYWVNTTITPFLDARGKPEKYIAIRTEITSQKAMELTAREQSLRLHTILDNLGEGVYTLDVDGRLTYLNSEAQRMTGWQLEEVVGQVLHDIIHHHRPSGEAMSAPECPIALAMQDNQIYRSSEEVFFRKDGTSFPVAMTGSPMHLEGKLIGSVAVFSDRTQAQILQRSLVEAKEAAQAATVAKSQFLSNMSHEIRTPMNAILGMLKLLGATELNARQLDYAGKAEGAAKSLLGLLNDILDFSKMEAGKMELDFQPFRFDQLLRDLSVILSANLGPKAVEVLFDIDPALPKAMVGDAMRLQQVLINLSTNAIKFTQRGEVVVQIKVLSQTKTETTFRVAVTDSGIGITLENQKRLFSEFSQAEASTTRRFGGTGLGLSISHRLVSLMGGELAVQSVIDEGSTFHFQLTLTRAIDDSDASGATEHDPIASLNVLVVDDNAVARDLLAAMLRSFGWAVDVAANGADAIALIAACTTHGMPPYQAIFMDWEMPGMDGWETIASLRQTMAAVDAPITVMVTAHGREALSQRSAQEQAQLNAFLVKPITASMLYDAVANAKAGRRNLREHSRQVIASPKRLLGMRVLVVEDNPINQQIARELLTAQGALVEVADNGLAGVAAVANAHSKVPFDAVLMDMQMPVMDGISATQAIRHELNLTQLPIIAMTANALASDRESCLAAGMNDHIGKPFDLSHLVTVLLNVTGFQVAEPADLSQPESPPPSSTTGFGDTDIDVWGALDRMSGMHALYVSLLREFVKDLEGVVAEYQRLLAIPLMADVARQMHTLKGTAATLGALGLSKLAAELEKLCKQPANMAAALARADELGARVTLTRAAFARVIQELDQSKDVASPDRSADIGTVQSALAELECLLANSDMSALQRYAELGDIQTFLAPNQREALDAAIQALDFRQALILCRTASLRLASTVSDRP